MPIPKPKSGEDRNTFVSRCIKDLSEKDPGMDNEQRIAICEKSYEMSSIIPYNEYMEYIKIKSNKQGRPPIVRNKNK